MTYYRDDHGDQMRWSALITTFTETYFRFSLMYCSAPITEDALAWNLTEAPPYPRLGVPA